MRDAFYRCYPKMCLYLKKYKLFLVELIGFLLQSCATLHPAAACSSPENQSAFLDVIFSEAKGNEDSHWRIMLNRLGDPASHELIRLRSTGLLRIDRVISAKIDELTGATSCVVTVSYHPTPQDKSACVMMAVNELADNNSNFSGASRVLSGVQKQQSIAFNVRTTTANGYPDIAISETSFDAIHAVVAIAYGHLMTDKMGGKIVF